MKQERTSHIKLYHAESSYVIVSPVSEEIFHNVMIEVGMREGATDPNTLWE